MKNCNIYSTITLIILFIFCFSCSTPNSKQNESNETNEKTYDPEYARKLGADDYGMKQYVLAYLKRGPNRTEDPAEAEKIQKGHMANINRLAEEGKLVLAGPFLDDTEIRGIFIFNTISVEEAEIWTNTDPAIQAGSLIMELHPWYGSAALIELNNLAYKAAKIQI